MYKRLASRRLRDLARRFPAVLILGARQVGKTTLARATFANARYLDLEEPSRRALFSADAAHQVESLGPGILILDEAQNVPDLFAALRGLIDARRRGKGRYVLLGSAHPALVRKISESLAGRIGLIELDALTAVEAISGAPKRRWQDVWLKGGFPDALKGKFRDWWEAYLRLYVERDLPTLGVAAQPLLLRRLLTMLAHQQGQLANTAQLGASLGVTHSTVQRYLDVLEQTFLIRRLPPYFVNIGKRLTKAPKIYLRDTGLLHHLLNIDSLEMLDSHPIRGASWETFVIEDLMRREKLVRPFTQFFFWRTHAGAEIDLLLERGANRIALEIKAGSGRSPYLARSVAAAAEDFSAVRSWVLDQAAGEDALSPKVRRRNYAESLDWLP
jgi:predicted AAA+ superfamily ATPase